MLEQETTSKWHDRSDNRKRDSVSCRSRSRYRFTDRWEVDHDLPSALRFLAECEVGWRSVEPEPARLFSGFAEHEEVMFRLKEAATVENESAFLNALKDVPWEHLSASDFARAIRLALQAGAHKAGRSIAERGMRHHPNDPEVKKYSSLLAPAKLIANTPTSEGWKRRTNYEWLKAHGSEYSGQWVAIQNGELRGVSKSLETLAVQFDSAEDVLLTAP